MKKITTFLIAILFIFSSVTTFAAFDDIDTNTLAWAGDAINYLTEAGIINGYTDGTFKANNNVTRAEFTKMIAVAFDTESANANYDDISVNWAKEYIAKIGNAMYSEGSAFNPDKDATRADIAYCVANILNLKVQDKSFMQKFSDHNEVLEAMYTMVTASCENGFVLGYEDGTLRPNNSVTRAEAAVIVYRALDFYNNQNKDPEQPPVTEPEQIIEKDHLANLYPGKDIILVVTVNKTIDAENGEDAYKINYRLANEKIQYCSIVPYDTKVMGIKTDIADLASGDVLIMNTAFHGYIGNLHVLASFGGGAFSFDSAVTSYSKGTYSLEGGLIKAYKQVGKNHIVTIESNGVQKDVYIPAGAETVEYASWKKGDKWLFGDLRNVDPETETEYIYIRYTNGVATDIIVSDFIR